MTTPHRVQLSAPAFRRASSCAAEWRHGRETLPTARRLLPWIVPSGPTSTCTREEHLNSRISRYTRVQVELGGGEQRQDFEFDPPGRLEADIWTSSVGLIGITFTVGSAADATAVRCVRDLLAAASEVLRG